MERSKPTPFEWIGNTVQQEHILRYLDRENPVGEIIGVEPFGKRGLTVRDIYHLDHTFICDSDGNVRRLSEEVERGE